MFDDWPKFIPIERAAELTVVALQTIACVQRTKCKINRGVTVFFPHVQTARPMTTLAADINEFARAKFTAITGSVSKTPRVTADALRIGVRFARRQGCKCLRMGGRHPSPRSGFMAGQTFVRAHICGPRSQPGNHVGA